MVEADFQGAKGQAFVDEFEQVNYPVEDLLTITLDSNKKRATFIASLNAVFRYLDLCDKTIHCKDKRPVECTSHLPDAVGAFERVLLIGYQPRFLETFASRYGNRDYHDKDIQNPPTPTEE